jgi:hypothetical protein
MFHPRAIVLRGGQVLAEHPLPPGSELVLGRSEGCDVTVMDGSVSRLHARLVADAEGVYVEDLGSANGTFVDGERTHGRVRLTHGQQVRAAQRAQSAPLLVRFEDVRPAPVQEDVAAALDAWDADRTQGADADRDTSPPFPSPASHQPLWPAGAPQPVVATTLPVAKAVRAEPAASPAPTPAVVSSRPRAKAWMWVLAAVVLVGGLAVAATAVWWLFVSRRVADTANTTATASQPARTRPAARSAATVSPQRTAMPPAPSRGEEVLVVPVESETGTASASASAAASLAAVIEDPLSGKWTARLENVFYPEDDYVVELRLDLHQRGGNVTGRGQVQIENSAMTFGVPATDVSGTVSRGAPPMAVRLGLAFGRPIGELQLEGTLDGEALAGTFRSTAAKQPGAWQAVRARP